MATSLDSIRSMCLPDKNMRYIQTSNWRFLNRLMDVVSGTALWAICGTIGGSAYGALCGLLSSILQNDIGRLFFYVMVFGGIGFGIGALLGATVQFLGGKKATSQAEPSSFEDNHR
jgi:hypothetical protein